MKLYAAVFGLIVLLNFSVPCQGLFGGLSLQDYVETLIDNTKYQLEGLISLNDSAIANAWNYFKTKYGRVYSSSGEEKQRISIFRDHIKYVLQSNIERFRTYQLELNEFADWTLAEFNAWKKGLIPSTSLRREMIDENDDSEESVRRSLKKLYQHHYHLRRLKRGLHRRHLKDRRFFIDSFWNLFNKNTTQTTVSQTSNILDWRTKSLVSSVKDQGKCGCCYAFATTTVLETLYVMKTKSSTLTEFSPQQLIDCSSNGNNGCSGGNFPPSIRFYSGQGGNIVTGASYPFAGSKQACRTTNINQVQLGNLQFGAITEGDEKQLQDAVTNYGPIFIGLDADSKLFMFYKSGVLNIPNCPTRRQDMDHALALVGYGYDNTLKTPYWIIKNSWGTKWGENGYLRLAKDSGNMCGVASMAYYGKLT